MYMVASCDNNMLIIIQCALPCQTTRSMFNLNHSLTLYPKCIVFDLCSRISVQGKWLALFGGFTGLESNYWIDVPQSEYWQTSQLSLFWCETQAFGPNLTLSLQTPQISLFLVSSLTLLTILLLLTSPGLKLC